MALTKIAVFCSARDNLSATYERAAHDVGQALGRTQRTLIYGGAARGLMEIVARSARQSGAHVHGIIPTSLVKSGLRSTHLDTCTPCRNVAERKELMIMQCDACVALPGGTGTLDEVFTASSMAQLGEAVRPIILYNVEGFWAPLLTLLAHLNQTGMLSAETYAQIHVADSTEGLLALLDTLT